MSASANSHRHFYLLPTSGGGPAQLATTQTDFYFFLFIHLNARWIRQTLVRPTSVSIQKPNRIFNIHIQWGRPPTAYITSTSNRNESSRSSVAGWRKLKVQIVHFDAIHPRVNQFPCEKRNSLPVPNWRCCERTPQ